jgi:hypothetical protein
MEISYSILVRFAAGVQIQQQLFQRTSPEHARHHHVNDAKTTLRHNAGAGGLNVMIFKR